MSPQEVADAYESKGYDFIAFTDHDYLLKPNYLDLYRQVKTNMMVFYGIELSVFVKGNIHVAKIEGDREMLHIFNHISEYDFTPQQLLVRLELLEKMYPLDAVEITKKGFRDAVFEALDLRYPKSPPTIRIRIRESAGRGWNWMRSAKRIPSSRRSGAVNSGTVT